MNQSRSMSAVETLTNVSVGYVLAVATQYAVFPIFNMRPKFGEHLIIGFAFVAVSIVRSYTLRRMFERWRR